MNPLYDLTIIGGGPAGVAAGVYAARKRLRTLFITADWGGQSAVSEDIQNWIGTVSISGAALAENLKNHLLAYAADVLTVKDGEKVTKIEKTTDGFSIATDGNKYDSRTVLIATGSRRRKLAVPGATEFENKGITYCASCDGPLFSDKDVAVIGGGNAAFETAAQLLAYTKSVTLFNRSEEFRADPVTVQKVLANPRMRAIRNAVPLEIQGEKFVNAIVYQNAETKEKITLATDGVFVEIGLLPITDFAKELVNIDAFGRIIVDPRTGRARLLTPPETTLDARRGGSDARGVLKNTTSATQRLRNEADEIVSGGVWAAGDCTDGLYHQNNIAAGDAVKALEDIYLYLHAK